MPRHVDRPRHNLPAGLSTFVGRAQELTALSGVLATTRLLSLVGAGGIGKTRLAVRLANEALPSYPDGVWMVELASLADPALIPKAVAATLGVSEQSTRPMQDVLMQALRPMHVLIVLDNCEHLVTGCAHFVATLLHACPTVHVLATSRESLGISGEVVRQIAPLPVPRPGASVDPEQLISFDAVRLFVDRVRSTQPDFGVTPMNARGVAEVCSRLDGIPLAIELAAARANFLSVEQIADRLNDRFALLNVGTRVAPRRHKTLRAAVEWSYQLLTETEQRMFERLTVFVGGCDLDGAEATSPDPRGFDTNLGVLGRLVDKSLVLADRSEDDSVRYRLLETLREYGYERLVTHGEAQTTHRLHASYFLSLAEEAEAALFGPRQGQWLVRLEREHDNLRAALKWAVTNHEAEIAVRLAAALGRFWWLRSHFGEGEQWFIQVLTLVGEVAPALRARVLNAAGSHAGVCLGDLERAAELHSEAVEIWRQIGDSRGIAWSLHNLGLVARDRGNLDEAERLFTESLRLYRTLEYVPGVISILRNIGLVIWEGGHPTRARPLFEESLAFARATHDSWGIAMSATGLGQIAATEGDLDLARSTLGEGLTALPMSETSWSLPLVLGGLVEFEIAREHPLRAAQLLGAAEAIRGTLGAPLGGAERTALDRKLATIRASMTGATFTRVWATGAAMSPEEAIAFAWQSLQLDQRDSLSPGALEPVHGTAPLTRREAEVAALVAQGLTNKEIAQIIIVTESTAAKHIEHILNKLGLRSRAQIAIWAAEKGLRIAKRA